MNWLVTWKCDRDFEGDTAECYDYYLYRHDHDTYSFYKVIGYHGRHSYDPLKDTCFLDELPLYCADRFVTCFWQFYNDGGLFFTDYCCIENRYAHNFRYRELWRAVETLKRIDQLGGPTQAPLFNIKGNMLELSDPAFFFWRQAKRLDD